MPARHAPASPPTTDTRARRATTGQTRAMDRVGDRAATVARVAAEAKDESERGRRLAPAVVAALEGSGLFGLVAPTALGGAAVDPATMVATIASIASADASAGWCYGIGA